MRLALTSSHSRLPRLKYLRIRRARHLVKSCAVISDLYLSSLRWRSSSSILPLSPAEYFFIQRISQTWSDRRLALLPFSDWEAFWCCYWVRLISRLLLSACFALSSWLYFQSGVALPPGLL